MHESSLARGLLRAALDKASHSGAVRILRVSGWVAESEALSRESLALHFEGLARGTIAAEAVLDLQVVHVQARCRACGAVYAPDHHITLCPTCGSVDGELLGKTGLAITGLEVEGP